MDELRAKGEVAAGPEASGLPDAVSRLLAELARAPAEDLATEVSLEPGQRVGRYEIRREIGRGGFGSVYEAFDPELGRSVALKTLRPGRSRRELSEDWIKQEAEAIARLDHPSIVTVHDVGRRDAGPYLVEELLRGETLAERLVKGPLLPEEALRVAEEMARGLAHAHHRGVLHRDLKPANVFLCEDGRVKLLDFGLAHLLGREGSSGGGTPAYMAPEQARGDAVDERADVYAAAVMLGESLTGKRPVKLAMPRPDDSPAVPATAPDLAGVQRAVARALAPALSADPASRPRDGTAWFESLRSARRSLERPRGVRRVALLGSAFLFLGLVVAGVATWRVWERQIPGGRPTVAVADFTNETGEKELDGISGLLITSLEQGTQLRVLTRGRMLDVLKQLGRGVVDRIDEPLAREIGRETRARTVLLASVRRLGSAYVVEMRALDPLHDEYIFTVGDRASSRDGLFGLVDRLGEATRKRLGVGGGAGAAPRTRIASITTDSVKAWELYSESQRAFDRDDLEESRRLAEAALEEDPNFALAHYQLALAKAWRLPDTPEAKAEVVRHIQAAERDPSRLPEKERLTLQALHAQVDDRSDDAVRLWDLAAQAYPLDKIVLLHAGEARLEQYDPTGAIPFFERVLQLDPTQTLAIEMLLGAMVMEGTSRRHASWLEERAETSRNPRELLQVAWAQLQAGLEKQALETWRRGQEIQGARPSTPPMYTRYLILAGRAPEAEAAVRRDVAARPANTAPKAVTWANQLLSMTLIGQGRFAEAVAVMKGSQDPPSEEVEVRALVALAGGDAAGVRAAVEELERVGKLETLPAAIGMMIVAGGSGDLSTLARLAEKVGPHPMRERANAFDRAWLDPFLAWGSGSRAAARQGFLALSSHGHVAARFWAHAMLGLMARDDGDCQLATAELRKAWNGGIVYPADDRIAMQSILLRNLALCHEKLGEPDRAREWNDEFLHRWARADPDAPMLVEAKAMRARLAAAAPGTR